MTEELVLKTHRDVFYQALLQHDWDGLARLYASDYMLVRSDGSVLSKSQVLEDLHAENVIFESIELRDEEVRIVGSVAILTGQSRTRVQHKGALLEAWFRLIAVYDETPGGLRLLHFQSTAIGDKSSSSQLPKNTAGDIEAQVTIASFVGAWELDSFTETLSDGSVIKPMGEDPQGFLLYTGDGIVSAQLAERGSDRQADSLTQDSSAIQETQQVGPSYIGYCGSFTVNSDLQEVVHNPVVAHDRASIGRALHRRFQLDGERLILKTSPGEAAGDVLEAQLIWRRRYHA